jgi:hypothetical protein
MVKKLGHAPPHHTQGHVGVSNVSLDSDLNCKLLMHVHGPNWPQTNKKYRMKTYQSRTKMLLRDTVMNVLEKAKNLQTISIAPLCQGFPTDVSASITM